MYVQIGTDRMSKVCLSFIFNHQYEKNIPKLRKIYGNRFSEIRFLSPFSTYNDDQEIIPIYETSIHFQGYIAQAYLQLPKNCEYYIFCADDLLLNPQLNEKNIISKLNCKNSAYIKYLNPVWEHSFAWHKFDESVTITDEDNLILTQQLLPPRNELLSNYEKHGFVYKNLGFQNLRGVHDKTISFKRIKCAFQYLWKHGLKRYVHLPLVEGYSDLIIIPGSYLKLFCHYCGIFSAMNLWVDNAIATSMVLSCENITIESDHALIGKEIWDPVNADKLVRKTDGRIDHLNSLFTNELLYIHPIKLSKFE